MAKTVRDWTVGDLADLVGGEAVGESGKWILRPVPAGEDDPNGITFAGNEAYLKKAMATGVGAILVPMEAPELGRTVIRVGNPRAAFGLVLGAFQRDLPLADGVHATAVISPEASVAPTARIGAFAVVEAGAVIEDGVRVFPQCYVGENCKIGSGSCLFPGVVLYQDVSIGEGCVLHSGVVLGADGFGFVWTGSDQMKIPQVGRVVLGNRVEVGANSCVDRATSGATRLGDSVKLDNLVHIGHNVSVGDHTVMAAGVGIAGSTSIGARVTMGGQAGAGDHVTVVDDVVLGGRAGATSDILEPGAYLGMPATDLKTELRAIALHRKLPEIYQRLRALEKRLEAMTGDENLSP